MKKILQTGLVLFIFSTPVLQAGAQNKFSLKLRKGQKLEVANNVSTVTTMELMGQPSEIKGSGLVVQLIEVNGKTDSSYKVAIAMKRIKTNMEIMGQENSFDSDKKEDIENERAKPLRDMLDKTTESEVDFKGKSFNKPADTSAGLNSDEAAAVLGIMKSIFGNDEKAQGTEDAFQVVPQGKKAGDGWADSVIADGVKTYRNFTLQKLNGKTATVSFEGTQVTSRTVEQMGMQATVNMNSRITGTIDFNPANGIVKQKNTSIEGTGTTEIMGQEIPVSTKAKSVITVEEK